MLRNLAWLVTATALAVVLISSCAAAERTPVTVLSGFLGAGKTSCLLDLLQSTDLRVGVIVNDLAALNIDASLVMRAGREVVRLQSGCACCEIKDELTEALIRLGSDKNGFDHIVVELSGVADVANVVSEFAAELQQSPQYAEGSIEEATPGQRQEDYGAPED